MKQVERTNSEAAKDDLYVLVRTWWGSRAAIVGAAIGVERTPYLVGAAKADGVLTGAEYRRSCKFKPAANVKKKEKTAFHII